MIKKIAFIGHHVQDMERAKIVNVDRKDDTATLTIDVGRDGGKTISLRVNLEGGRWFADLKSMN